MDVLLVAPIKDSYSGLAQYPPVGLGYLAYKARQAGHSIRILDCLKERMDFADFDAYFGANSFDVVGINVWTLAIAEVKKSLEIIKQRLPRAITVIGGPHPSAVPEGALGFFHQADFAFRGEAELGFTEFLNLIEKKGDDFQKIAGLTWRGKDKIEANPPYCCQDLDELGFPSWDLIDPRRYFTPGALISKDTAVLTCTRGCPYQCTFCSAWITAGRKVRRRSVRHILSEIEYLHKNFGIRIFDIPDENFTFDKKFVMEFCDGVIPYKRKFEFFLPNGIRLDSLDTQMLSAMKKAGFRREIAVGIESGSERILAAMKKNLSLDEVREKVSLLNECGFRPIGYFILGFPGETKDDLNKTLQLALELDLCAAAFTPFAPMPGTEATEKLVNSGELAADFDFTSVKSDVVTYAPQGMKRQELDEFRKFALLKFNLRPKQFLYYLSSYNGFKFALVKFFNLFIKGRQVSE